MRRRLLALLIGLIGLVLIGPYLIPLPAQPDRAAEDVAPPGGRFVTAGGVRTFVEEAGPAGGPAVVLVHGFGGSTFNWRYTLPALGAAGYRGVALDLKGFGLSGKSFEEDYSHAAQADFVAAVMTELGIERATLVGHSMGGSVVAHFALRHPERAERLVFATGAVRPPGQEGGASFGLPAGAAGLVSFPPFRRWGQLALRLGYSPERVTAMLRSAYHDPEFITPEVIAGALRPQQLPDWDLALLGILRDGDRNALPRPAGDIRAPVLIVWGEHDTWVPLARGEQLRAGLPQAEWVLIPRAGHLLMEEQAGAFNAALLEFLR